MGWTSSGDQLDYVGRAALFFYTKEEAINFWWGTFVFQGLYMTVCSCGCSSCLIFFVPCHVPCFAARSTVGNMKSVNPTCGAAHARSAFKDMERTSGVQE